jgi:signal transduction histidine kinase
MMVKTFGWKLLLALIAVMIVVATFFYSDMLAGKIAEQEKKEIEEWVAAQQLIAAAGQGQDLTLASIIVAEQRNIPVIETNERDSIMNFLNLDTAKVTSQPNYLQNELSEYKQNGRVIRTYLDPDGNHYNLYYYGESRLLNQVRYFPLIQLLIVILFSILMVASIANRYRSEQNHLWAGLAKETAHQLGTPISALQGWLEILNENKETSHVTIDMEKDIDRLKLISDRFSMIGGTPIKENQDLVKLTSRVIDYMRKRASEKTSIEFKATHNSSVNLMLSASLIEWVLENLIKNSLDAMKGKGMLTISIEEDLQEVHLDITDTGSGIEGSKFNQVFFPGYSTKKRGWGVGLTLSKRIIEDYHGGILFVKHSVMGIGTTFRITLKK